MMDRRQLEDALAASERATRLLRDALGLSPRVIADTPPGKVPYSPKSEIDVKRQALLTAQNRRGSL